MQEGNCTISDLHRNYFAPTDVYRIGEYMQTITSDTNILFVCNDGRSFLYFNGTYTPFEKMDNTVHTGSPDVYVTQNGTILHAYFPNSGLKKLERTADFPRVLSVGTTFNGFVGLYAICSEYFIGASCEIPVCNGVPANETRVCSGQGTCVRPNTCLCNSNYRGLYCDQQVTTCNTGLSIAVVALSVALALALFFILLIFVVLCVVQYRVSKNKKQRLAQESLSMNLLDQDFKDQVSLHQE
jgi:cbb3-type cytochrome oxidase subunit 3